MLRQLVKEHGLKSWSTVSKGLVGRTGKSCRLRCVTACCPPNTASTALCSLLPAAQRPASRPLSRVPVVPPMYIAR